MFQSGQSVVSGVGYVIRKDGTKVPFEFEGTTSLGEEEVREALNVPGEVKEDSQEHQS